jgi:hypothetical protein
MDSDAVLPEGPTVYSSRLLVERSIGDREETGDSSWDRVESKNVTNQIHPTPSALVRRATLTFSIPGSDIIAAITSAAEA